MKSTSKAPVATWKNLLREVYHLPGLTLFYQSSVNYNNPLPKVWNLKKKKKRQQQLKKS